MPAKTISLDEQTIALLDRTGNASAYLRGVVQQRAQDLQQALVHLEARGYSRTEMLLACDALNGTAIQFALPLAVQVGADMADAVALGQTSVSVSENRAKEIEAGLTESDARAFYTIVQEFWAGNDWLKDRLAKSRPASSGDGV